MYIQCIFYKELKVNVKFLKNIRNSNFAKCLFTMHVHIYISAKPLCLVRKCLFAIIIVIKMGSSAEIKKQPGIEKKRPHHEIAYKTFYYGAYPQPVNVAFIV